MGFLLGWGMLSYGQRSEYADLLNRYHLVQSSYKQTVEGSIFWNPPLLLFCYIPIMETNGQDKEQRYFHCQHCQYHMRYPKRG